ncbi:hypothetical protein MGS313_PGAPTMP_002146 [Burkholderia pseudomallei]
MLAARGPFSLEGDSAPFGGGGDRRRRQQEQRRGGDGGETRRRARARVPVVMVERPALPDADREFGADGRARRRAARVARAVTGRARMRGRETGERRDVARRVVARAASRAARARGARSGDGKRDARTVRAKRRARRSCAARPRHAAAHDDARRRTACEARRAACDAGVSRGSRLAALGARRIVLESSNE